VTYYLVETRKIVLIRCNVFSSNSKRINVVT